jgi:hypothetical protein
MDHGSQTPAHDKQNTADRGSISQSREWAYLRISSRVGKRFLDHWTTHDVLTFLADPALSVKSLEVEVERASMRPVAW